jgi:outer membrane protein TolC
MFKNWQIIGCKSFGLLFLFAIQSEVNAQNMTLQQCIEKAKTNNLTLSNASIDAELTQKKRDEVAAGRLPQVSLSGDYKYNAIIPGQVIPAAIFGGPVGTYTTVKFGVPWNLGTTITATQILFNPQISYGLKVAALVKDISKLQYKQAEQDVVYQLSSTYFAIQAIDQNVKFIDNNLVSLSKLEEKVKAMKENGMAKQTDVDKFSIQSLSLSTQKLNIEATRAQLINVLKLLMGMPNNENIDIVREISTTSNLSSPDKVTRVEMELLESQKLLTSAEKNSIKLAYLPTLVAYAAYNTTFQARTGSDAFSKTIPGAFIGVKLEWTLFDGLAKVHRMKQNTLNAKKNDNNASMLQQSIDNEIANSLLLFDAATAALSSTMKQQELAQKVYDQTETSFKEGVVSSTEVIQSQSSLQEAQNMVSAAYLAIRNAELAVLKANGNLLDQK